MLQASASMFGTGISPTAGRQAPVATRTEIRLRTGVTGGREQGVQQARRIGCLGREDYRGRADLQAKTGLSAATLAAPFLARVAGGQTIPHRLKLTLEAGQLGHLVAGLGNPPAEEGAQAILQ
jgi:hypothetical protein